MFLYGQGQQLQYAVANSMLASLYAEYMKATDVPGWYCHGTFYPAETLNDWARSQVRLVTQCFLPAKFMFVLPNFLIFTIVAINDPIIM